MEKFVKALIKDGLCIEYITLKLPGLTMEKLKAGIINSPQIRLRITDPRFIVSMNEIESRDWSLFDLVVKNVLINRKGKKLHTSSRDFHFIRFHCNMSIDVHYLHSNLDGFLYKLGTKAKCKMKDLTTDRKTAEANYQWRWDANMMTDYIWNLMQDYPGRSDPTLGSLT